MNKKINQIINKLKGARFVHNGRSIEEGIDCLGFLILFYKEFGVELPSDDGQYVDKEWYLEDPDRYVRGIKNLGYKEVSLEELKPLDLIYFVINHDVITHTGIKLNDNFLFI
ncbi:C40 family peptidase [Gottschalkia acidurici]|uniref:C40 family peptidase n=1 Tax=Clostridium acidurici TaxID=1556 RepID=UPI0002E29E16|nr:NlpC/P60 family protein [Gottschalkia acidurici]